MFTSKDHVLLEELILKNIDGVITDSEFTTLCDMLRTDKRALDYYLEFISLCGGLLKPGEIETEFGRQSQENIDSSELWEELAEHEQHAESIYIEEETPLPEVIKFETKQIVHPVKRSKSNLYVAVLLATILYSMITYVIVFNSRETRTIVASVTGSHNAVWSKDSDVTPDYNRLYTKTPLTLLEGFAEITFDNQARLIVQSPAVFEIENYDQIYLRSGKVSARIPKSAYGFVIRTPGASVVDYGTEFGVTANSSGQTDVLVFEGKVELRSGHDPLRFENKIRLAQGQASSVDEKGSLSPVRLEANSLAYVRHLPQDETFGQPGKRLDLADIFACGNGFGTGRGCVAINPMTGQLADEPLHDARTISESNYSPVELITAIDGVFVPFGGMAPQKVSTQGHEFRACPKTDGRYWADISNNPLTGLQGESEYQLARLNNVEYGSAIHPAIMMHANTGITFDLNKIRELNPGIQIQRFTTTCGLSETLLNSGLEKKAEADLWVLIDGQPRKRIHVSFAGISAESIAVTINENDQFLTLMSTSDWNAGDWTLFGDPALEFNRFKP